VLVAIDLNLEVKVKLLKLKKNHIGAIHNGPALGLIYGKRSGIDQRFSYSQNMIDSKVKLIIESF